MDIFLKNIAVEAKAKMYKLCKGDWSIAPTVNLLTNVSPNLPQNVLPTIAEVQGLLELQS